MTLPTEINPVILTAPNVTGDVYSVTKSLRFRASAGAYLNKTPASSGSLTTYTWSAWVKFASISGGPTLLSAGNITGNIFYNRIGIDPSGSLGFYNYPNGGPSWWLYTANLLRDPSAWYHIVVVLDTTNATQTNRVRIYINGVIVTNYITLTFAPTYPALNDSSSLINNSSYQQRIGRNEPGQAGLSSFDGCMAEVNFIDGQALTASSFGRYNQETGVWQPKSYTGTYGTNGYYLKYTNTSSTATLGNDFSGNGNTWTTNNFSLTAGSTYDSMLDSPTPYFDGTAYGVGNYATLNPLNKSSIQTLSNANLTIASSGTLGSTLSTMAVNSGQWYWEGFLSALSSNAGFCDFGFALATFGITNGLESSNAWCVNDTGQRTDNGTNTASWAGSNFVAGTDILMCAVDLTNGKAWFGKNGTWFQSGNPATGANPAVTSSLTGANITPAIGSTAGISRSFTWNLNFGQRPFTYAPPSGFKALNTFNLPAGSTAQIANGASHMAATTYTGTGAANTSIINGTNNNTGITFAPDLVWIKARTKTGANPGNNTVWDTVRGVAGGFLVTNLTDATGYDGNGLSAFNTNGWTMGSSAGLNNLNDTFVGWQWKAGQGTTSSNTNGSLTSTVSVNRPAGFSIVTYTATNVAATIGHGLGVTPALIIIKDRDSVSNWPVWHSALSGTEFLQLNSTAAKTTGNTTYWNSTTPTSTVFSVGTSSQTNNNGDKMLAYCWAAIPGYSAFGSYTGNGSADGPFVYCGFRPRWILIKRSDVANDWYIQDTSTNTYNVIGNTLLPNTSAAEANYVLLDSVSNGFKLRTGIYTSHNASGGTYIYAAFAENPFKYSLAR